MKLKALDGTDIDLRTGDELLCSGRSKMSRRIIMFNVASGAQNGAISISHVAKYVNGMVYEATTLNKWCDKKGYQANPFDFWLQNYNGSVWVRQTDGCDIDEARYQELAESDIGIPYEHGIPGVLELLLTTTALKRGPEWLKRFARKHLATKALHCSEANVRRSQQSGYYDRTIRPNKMPPYKFWTGGEYEKGFIKGRLLSPVKIK